MTINRLELRHSAHTVVWWSNGLEVRKTYSSPAQALILAAQDAVLAIEPSGFPHNAVIYNEDGTERTRVRNPLQGAICFASGGYENGELVVVSRLRGLEVACFLDDNGVTHRTQELR